MTTDDKVRKYRCYLERGRFTREQAAARAGLCAKTARKWETGPMPSAAKTPRHWRTRSDPFTGAWEEVIVPELEEDKEAIFEATFLFSYLQDERPGQFDDGQLRTFQRRVRDYRALYGPEQEVYFPQVYVPGKRAQLDFTHTRELGITIGRLPFAHLLFECILCYSGHRYVRVVPSESYEALFTSVQEAFVAFGGVPEKLGHDQLSAAVHNLRSEDRHQVNEEYRDRLKHYGTEPYFINVASPNENGCVERGHGVLKKLLRQAMKLRGSCDFASREDYEAFLNALVERLNRNRQKRWEEEWRALKPLPATLLPTYSEVPARVSKWSLIQVKSNLYSVPSRLIGHQVQVRIYLDRLEVYYGTRLVETLPRLLGRGGHRINYRHIIHSLIRKPGAFADYRFREELFPSLAFRQAYDFLGEHSSAADLEYLRILHLAATTMECEVEAALGLFLEAQAPFTAHDVKTLVEGKPRPEPVSVAIDPPELDNFDELISGELREQLCFTHS